MFVTESINSAAELRAAAAERRLAGLAGPSTPVKDESDEGGLMAMKDEQDEQDDEADVLDPRMSADARKREMEAGMDDGERTILRGGFEDYIKVEPGISGPRVKRELSHDSPAPGPPDNKKPTRSKSGFGTELINQERLKALGLKQTTLSSSARPLGSASVTRTPNDAKLSAGSVWDCQTCTFRNDGHRDRCGEWARTA